MSSGNSGISRIVRGISVIDGAGVRLHRIIGSPRLSQVDPFVLLDEFKSDNPKDYMAGFPDHPHRGIETITYMIAGKFRHKDSRGGGGLLAPGCVQWMTAGKGIIHSEMPEMEDGRLWGYQLWLTLAAKDKMIEPRYQHLNPAFHCQKKRCHRKTYLRKLRRDHRAGSDPVSCELLRCLHRQRQPVRAASKRRGE